MNAVAAPSLPLLPGAWPEVMRRHAGLAAAIATWLPSRRWFSGKAATVSAVSIEDVYPLPARGSDAVLLVVAVAFIDGEQQQLYAIPLMSVARQHADPKAAVARLDGDALLVDAMTTPLGSAAMVRVACTDAPLQGQHACGRGRPRRHGLSDFADDDVRPLGVEQSNSSVLVGDALIAKLVRRIESGSNPDAELPAHLSAVGFAHAPGVAATFEIDIAGRAPAEIVIVHDKVDNEGDLWSVTLTALERIVAADGRFDPNDAWSQKLAALLGTRTAELHAALARPGDGIDEPRPLTLEDQRQLVARLRESVNSTQRAVRRAGLDTAEAAIVMRPVADVLERFQPLRTRSLDARQIRVHGDLHLGQILWTGTDVVFIDFEGEPGRPIADRRATRDPLVDVAGLVRSIDYAGRSALDAAVGAGAIDRIGHDHDRHEWTRRTCATLTTAYLDAAADAALVPAQRDDADLLLDAHTMHKGLYEIRYELANRPAWVGWPLAAVAEMIER